MRKLLFYFLIPKGSENALDARSLAKASGLQPSDIPGIVEDFRQKGKPIAGNEEGYYIPATEEELARYVKGVT